MADNVRHGQLRRADEVGDTGPQGVNATPRNGQGETTSHDS